MSTQWHGGKGSKSRPIENRKQFEDNWDRIFGKKNTDAPSAVDDAATAMAESAAREADRKNLAK